MLNKWALFSRIVLLKKKQQKIKTCELKMYQLKHK